MGLTFKAVDGRGRRADRDDKLTWYPEWREALELVISSGIARERIKFGTPERSAADREHEDALERFAEAGRRIQ